MNAAELLAALGHESRLAIFRLLVEAGPEGVNASAIGEQLQIQPATLSFHLAHLSRVGLIRGRKESRFIRYAADYTTMDELLAFLTHNCCQGEACLPKTAASNTIEKRRSAPKPVPERTAMSGRIFNVLFLCTGNSARSILAEAILNRIGQGRFRAYSAGSHPAGQVNPLVLEALKAQRFPTTDLRSKNWDEFAQPDAPPIDFVFTVCDKAAGAVCPAWPGQPMTAHWGIEDPAAVEGGIDAKRHAVALAMHELQWRIQIFVSLPVSKLDALSMQRELDDIGRLPRQAG